MSETLGGKSQPPYPVPRPKKPRAATLCAYVLLFLLCRVIHEICLHLKPHVFTLVDFNILRSSLIHYCDQREYIGGSKPVAQEQFQKVLE